MNQMNSRNGCACYGDITINTAVTITISAIIYRRDAYCNIE